jgi:hypothetical protein
MGRDQFDDWVGAASLFQIISTAERRHRLNIRGPATIRGEMIEPPKQMTLVSSA